MTERGMEYRLENHNFDDPDPWVALGLDRSTFFDARAKEALLRGNGSKSRQFLLPIVRPLARLSIVLVQLIRLVIPNRLHSSAMLHGLIVWGMKHFVSPDANFLIIRHFNIGSQILKFLADDISKASASSRIRCTRAHPGPARQRFIQHDLNIYNFIIQINALLGAADRKIEPVPLPSVNFSAIRDVNDSIAETAEHLAQFPRSADRDRDLHPAVRPVPDRSGLLAFEQFAPARRDHRLLHREDLRPRGDHPPASITSTRWCRSRPWRRASG